MNGPLVSRLLPWFKKDKLGLTALGIVGIYFLIAVSVRAGFVGEGWEELVTDSFASMSWEHPFGANRNGQDIFKRVLFSTKTAFEVGVLVSILSTIFGAVLGAVAGYFAGTWIDELVLWFMGCLDSIPFFLFVAALAVALRGNPHAMEVSMVATFWTTTARLIRGEVIKFRGYEFVEAARALGMGSGRILFRHILPNTTPILLVQTSIVFVTAIKSEVILSFLGLGVKDGISWGLMIAEAASEVTSGDYNNLIAASSFMFVLVMAFNIFSDSLQDALDPKKVMA